MSIWVCKFDGTIQCDPNSTAVSLEEMRKQLETLIGAENVLGQKTKSFMMIQLCGMPTGAANSYEITEEGWRTLNDGIVGPNGFFECNGKHTELQMRHSVQSNPTLIKELVGHPIRVYKTGDGLTQDWRPARVNFETNDGGDIVDIWFG